MQSINPATEEVIAQYTEHSPQQIDKILTHSAAAFDHWRQTDIASRALLMTQLVAVLRRHRAATSELMTAEVGKTIVSSEVEVEKCAAACEFFALNAERFLLPQAIASDASRSYVRFDPLGPVLAIMPWNFPLWQVFRFAAPTIMAGNVGVLKHAPNVSGCALAIERMFHEAGFPHGVFSAILLADNQQAQKLVAHPVIRAVTLTGSERAGSAVAAEAGKLLKKTVMELGGSDPFIVLRDADIPSVAKAAAEARCINNGQSCIAAKRFIVEEPIAEQFESAFAAALRDMKIGNPMDRATQIGPLARLDLLENLHSQVQRSLEHGAVLATGGQRLPTRGFFYEPTLLTHVTPGMPAFDEETFGPVAAVIRAKNSHEAIELANQSAYGLGASIWTTDLDHAQSLAADLQSGSVFINGPVKSDSRLPFGGIKNSGWGRELSEFGSREFTNIKTIWIR